jgi:uncharacterized protein YecT (DUF1311 family)
MSYRRAIVFALLACWPRAGVAQQRAPSECLDSAKAQAAITACAGDSYQAADRRLRQLVAELRDSVPIPQRARLDSAQHAWAAYSAVQCRLEAAPYAGGTIYATQVTSCRRLLAERRIAELAPLLCRPSGQPGRPCPAADRYRQPERAASKRRH